MGEDDPVTTTGRLVLAGVPLGNPGDASARLVTALREADIVAAEDTRRLRRLAADLGAEVPGRVVSYFDGNEERRTPELAEQLRDGATVLVVTDGGMPSVSDPGYRLVVAAIADGVPVQVVPGPSAVTTALAASGLPVDRFCFEGFPPRKPSARRATYAALADEPRTLVFFEAPHRIAASLGDLAAAFGGDRPAAVCRELTKTYEEVRRGTLAELAEWAADGLRGEITVVVAGAPAQAREAVEPAVLAAEVTAAVEAGTPRKEALSAVATAHGIPRRAVYDAVLAAKNG
ncbi:MAG TPA: 16S rRNA (cytidine(1402)-2'-O)-methyltransferase [Mycobacteriales bacterium]|jgi:16S rRNA (cytidine1402-2'-O)-methyltransferase|nr:16S rRNA (cytidine(1402)-2'-O)-methyltransferase [Mycobacteriales bacterium]